MSEVFPHFFMLDLPKLVGWEEVDWTKLDAVFCGLPHGTTQDIIAAVLKANPKIKVLDMSADFRLRDMKTYAEWYGHEHRAPHLQGEAVYGLTEFYRDDIAKARLVACPGCYPTATLLAAGADRQADRHWRHHRRCEVGHHRCWPRPEAEHAVLRSPAKASRPTRSPSTGTRRRSSRRSPQPPASAA